MSELTQQTIELFQDVVAKHKSAGDTFCKAYEAALIDLGGEHWRTLPPDELTRVVQRVHQVTYKLAVTELGLERSAFTRYAGGARRKILFDLPFSFAKGASIAECRRAIELAAADTNGTPQARMQRAIDKLNAEKTERAAAMLLQQRRHGGTYLSPPEPSQSPKMNAEALLAAIAEHLQKPEVVASLQAKNKPAARLRQILAIAKPGLLKAIA